MVMVILSVLLKFSDNSHFHKSSKNNESLNDDEIHKLQNKTNCDKPQNDASLSIEQDIKQNENENKKKINPTLESRKTQLLPKVGDMIIFTSYTYHKSNPNISNKMRRVIMTQYSTFPIIDRTNKKLARLVVKL